MSESDVTPENDPTNHARLMAIWEADKRPGWVVAGKTTYKVIQRGSDHVNIFRPVSNQSMYESTSF